MWPDRVLNPGPLTYESGALPITLRGLLNQNSNTLLNKDNKHDRNDNQYLAKSVAVSGGFLGSNGLGNK